MREYFQRVVQSYGGYYKDDYWYIPSFPDSPFTSKTQDIYTAYVLTLDAIKLKTKNQA